MLEADLRPRAAEHKQRRVKTLPPGDPALPCPARRTALGGSPFTLSQTLLVRNGVAPRGDAYRPHPHSCAQTGSSPPGDGAGSPTRTPPPSPAEQRGCPPHSPSLVKIHEEHHVVPEARQSMGRGHGDDEGEDVVDEGVEGLPGGTGEGGNTGRQLSRRRPPPATDPDRPRH